MQMSTHAMDPEAWAESQFGGLDLGDTRRGRRAVKIAGTMASRPGQSLPELFPLWADTKAAYQLFMHEAVHPDSLQATHRRRTLEEMNRPGTTVLLIGDTSDIVYRRGKETPGLGPIAEKPESRGFLLHTMLAVAWPEIEAAPSRRPVVEILGLADQRYEVRKPRPEHEKRKRDSRQSKTRERESQIWDHSAVAIGPAPAHERWIHVEDRGADIYEHMIQCKALGHGFVIRAAHDRRLEDPVTGERCGTLFSTARAAPPLGRFDLDLPAQPQRAGKRACPSRTARLAVSAARVIIQSPQRPGHGQGALSGIPCTVVRVYEENPPEGVEALEWFLLCDEEVATFDQARERGLIYATRWVIEEFHKALKTGLGAEKLQLESGKALFAAVAIMSVVALRLVQLRETLRLDPEAPAEQSGFSPLELRVLAAATNKTPRTVRDAALALGRLGGHLGRKSDGMPGWITLWRGVKQLYQLLRGIRLAGGLDKFG